MLRKVIPPINLSLYCWDYDALRQLMGRWAQEILRHELNHMGIAGYHQDLEEGTSSQAFGQGLEGPEAPQKLCLPPSEFATVHTIYKRKGTVGLTKQKINILFSRNKLL